MSDEDAIGWSPRGYLIFTEDELRDVGITLVPARRWRIGPGGRDVTAPGQTIAIVGAPRGGGARGE